jgi:uncharacterized protein YggE
MRIGGVMKISAVALVAAFAVAAGGCGGAEGNSGTSSGQGSPLGQNAASQVSYQPTSSAGTLPGITVVGTGSAHAVPDVSDWSFGVQSDADTASAALKEASAATQRILDALRGAGISKEDLRTEQVSLYPQMSSDGRAVVGYSASSSVQATVHRISEAGSILDAAVAAGANQVSGPMLRVSDSRAQYRDAAAVALEDARARAQALAAEAGVTLGAPIAIIDSGGGGTPIPVYDRLASDAAEMPIEPGTQEISASLTVTFAIS